MKRSEKRALARAHKKAQARKIRAGQLVRKRVFTRKFLEIKGSGRNKKKILHEVRITTTRRLGRNELRAIARKVAAKEGYLDKLRGKRIEREESRVITKKQAKREGIFGQVAPEIEVYTSDDSRYSNT